MVMQSPARTAERAIAARDGPTSKEALERFAQDIMREVENRIVAAVKVIRHEQDQLFEKKIRELKQEFERKVKSLEGGVKTEDFARVREEVKCWVDEIGKEQQKSLSSVREEFLNPTRLNEDDAAMIAGRVARTLGGGFDKSLEDQSSRINSLYSRFETVALRVDAESKSLHETMIKDFDGRVDLLSKSYENSVNQVRSLLELLRDNPAIINVQASPVAVQNILSPAEINVNVPQQAPPVINVSPELKAADIVVNVPPTPAREKLFEYDETGRPLRVVEKDL